MRRTLLSFGDPLLDIGAQSLDLDEAGPAVHRDVGQMPSFLRCEMVVRPTSGQSLACFTVSRRSDSQAEVARVLPDVTSGIECR